METQEQHHEQEELDPWSLYQYAIKSPVTRDKYQRRLATFFKFIGLAGKLEDQSRTFALIGRRENGWALNNIVKFLQIQRDRVNRKEISGGTVRNYVKSIKLFCEMADVLIQWKKLTRGLPKGKKYADDRLPTTEETRKLLQYPDRRIKAIIYTMASSGIRLGAWDYLRWGDILPIERNGQIIAARVRVYAGEDEEYLTFITGDSGAFGALKEWMEYRQNSGESINDKSWVMRDLWDTRIAQGRGLVTRPNKLPSSAIKRLMERAIWAQGLRKKLQEGKKRHPYQANHCWRKWFKTRCENSGMKPINIEILLSHSVGISDSYYRPTENDLLEDYLKAAEHLTLDSDRFNMQENPNKDFIKGILDEKDQQLDVINKKYDILQSQFQTILSSLNQLDQSSKNMLAKKMFHDGIYKPMH